MKKVKSINEFCIFELVIFLGAMTVLGQLTIYGTTRPRGVNKNAKTFRKQKQK